MRSKIQELIDIVCAEGWTPETQAMGESAKAEFELVKAKQWEKDLDKRLAGLWAQTPAEGTTQERLL